MPKRDAFGREIGEDTLAGLGGAPEPAAAEPAVHSAPAERDAFGGTSEEEPDGTARPAQPESAREQAVRRELLAKLGGTMSQVSTARTGAPRVVRVRGSRAGVGCLVSLLLLLGLGGGAVALLVMAGRPLDVRGGGTTTIARPSLPSLPGSEPAPKGLAAGSLARPAELALALRRIRTAKLGRLTSLRVAPERIDAQLLNSGGRLRSVQVRPGRGVDTLGGASGPGFDFVPTIPFARIDTQAPTRLVRAGAPKVGQRTSDLQYLVPTLSSGKVSWVAYFKRARYVIGDAAGRYQRSFP